MAVKQVRTDIVLHGRLSGLLEQTDLSKLASRMCRISDKWPVRRLRKTPGELFLFSYLSDLADDVDVVMRRVGEVKRFILFQDKTPIESVAELLTKLNVRTSKRLHVARLEHDTEWEYLSRFISALNSNDDGSIMDAWWDGDELVVISPTLERIRVRASLLPQLCDANGKEREAFEIDAYGSFIYWPDCDVHMGWSQFKQLVEPQLMLRAKQKSEQFNKQYGLAIRMLRQEQGIRQSDIVGLDCRTVRRIEKGETRATSKALACLAKVHGMGRDEYMNEVAKRLGSCRS